MRHTIKIAVMIVAVAVAVFSGVALAQSSDDDAVTGFHSQVLEQLAPLVDGGVITQDQANAIAESFADQSAERQQLREERRALRQANHQELLDLLDTTAEDLRAAISEGMTLAEVAQEQGVEVQSVIDLLVGHAEDRIAQAIDDGRLSAEEAEEKLAEITQKITDKVNNGGGFECRRGYHRGFGRSFGGGGFGPPADAPATGAINA